MNTNRQWNNWFCYVLIFFLGGIIFCSYFWFADKTAKSALKTMQKASNQFSWLWDAITTDQANDLVSKVSATGSHSVMVYSVSPACRNLATSLDEVFARAKWTHNLRIGPPIAGMVVGICVTPNNPTAKIVKDSIESATAHMVSIKNLKGVNNDSITEVIIGVKPVPSPIPLELQGEIKSLGQNLKELSTQILIFAADRKREEGLLPPRESYSPNQNGLLQNFERSVAFSKETESLYNTKFSGQASPYLTQLGNMGIALPFFLQRSESRPEGLGKWFAVVGDWLVGGKIEEARSVGNDEHLWFYMK